MPDEIIEGVLFERCRAGDFGMVIIDPAYMVQDGDENNAHDIREFFAKLDEVCVRLRTTVVISHHHSKGAQGLKRHVMGYHLLERFSVTTGDSF